MTKKFGKPGSNRAGTGTIAEDNVEKWTGSVAAQVATAAQVKGIITKTVPVDYVVTDPENPRRLAISQNEIIAIAKEFPLDKNQLDVGDKTEWIEDYIQKVAESKQLSGKALGDFESLVTFAAALKSADRMLHPVVVSKNESTFHLIAGERRLLAHILLGEKHIAARITDEAYNRSEIDTLQWEENVHRLDMNLWERIERVKKIIEAGEGVKKISVTKLAKIIGRSRAECQRYLAVLRYPTDLLIEAIKNGEVNDLKKAASLAQLPPKDLTNLLNGTIVKPAKMAVKFNDKEKAPAFGFLIKAAASNLKAEHLIASYDLDTLTGVNNAINALLTQMELQQRG